MRGHPARPREQPRHPLQTENRQRISTLTVFLWARVDYASRAAKNSPLGCFCAVFRDSAAAVRIHPPSLREGYYKTETPVPDSDTGVLGGRGWTTQAAHLKKPRRGFFPRRTVRRVDAVRIHPHENPNLLQTENRQRISTLTVFLWARVDSNKLNYHNSLDAL